MILAQINKYIRNLISAWWYISKIPVLRNLRREPQERRADSPTVSFFKGSLGYIHESSLNLQALSVKLKAPAKPIN